MAVKLTSMPHILIPKLQLIQNGGRSDFWRGCKTRTRQSGTMKCWTVIDLEMIKTFCTTILWKKYQCEGRLNFIIHNFMESTHELFHLEEMYFCKVKEQGHPTSFICIINLFDNTFIYGEGAKFWGYVGTNAELSAEFCNYPTFLRK
jgi:hypothetical protein